ncbi:unnamed protein product [Dibothriocephalus latus]|uniref:Uncharacterized protein n=1 Tax=Dibothriocephalus latus TaxID=60516 RepID=A0A3P7MDB4_DIBLA|nr:unnamed protein product [Dibothriocephalus latus]
MYMNTAGDQAAAKQGIFVVAGAESAEKNGGKEGKVGDTTRQQQQQEEAEETRAQITFSTGAGSLSTMTSSSSDAAHCGPRTQPTPMMVSTMAGHYPTLIRWKSEGDGHFQVMEEDKSEETTIVVFAGKGGCYGRLKRTRKQEPATIHVALRKD